MKPLLRSDIDGELADARAKAHRLTDWENKFVENISQAWPNYELTPAQRMRWREIEDKVYATG